jgi:hypothetical protein
MQFLGIGDGAYCQEVLHVILGHWDGVFCQEVLREILGHWGWGVLSGSVACNSWALEMGCSVRKCCM